MNFKMLIAMMLSTCCFQAFAQTNIDMSPPIDSALIKNSAANAAVTNLQEGTAFLIQNKDKPGVVTLADGLQYKVIKAGTGPKPAATDTVTVEYIGRFIDGQEFDSSAQHGGKVDFVLNQVIPGWVEAVQLMQKGSVWEIYVPANLAYGEQGAPPAIGPNKTLIFVITLVDFKKNPT